MKRKNVFIIVFFMLTAAVLLVTTACENPAGATTGTGNSGDTGDTGGTGGDDGGTGGGNPLPTYVDTVDAFLIAPKDPAIKAIEITKHIEIPINADTAIDGKTITRSSGVNSVTITVKDGKNLQMTDNTTLTGIVIKHE